MCTISYLFVDSLVSDKLFFGVCVQVASRVLGIPCSKIHISETSTNTVPNTSPTAASASSDLNGAAVQNACEVLVKRLEPYKAKNPKGSWEQWVRESSLTVEIIKKKQNQKDLKSLYVFFVGAGSLLRQSEPQRKRLLQVSPLNQLGVY